MGRRSQTSARSDLQGRVALVTGGSRGVGKGIAEELAEAGAVVYATGRSTEEETRRQGEGETRSAPAGPVAHGMCIPVKCDHTDDAQVEAVFQRIEAEAGRIDVLVNNVWGGYERMVEGTEFTWTRPFWRQPIFRWDSMFAAGVRAHYVASCFAARKMVEQQSGLIVNISFWAAQKHVGNVAYGVSKAATDKLTADMAHELKAFGVAVVSLYPGLVRTEKVLEAAAYLDLSNSESPRFVGRAVAALAADPNVMAKSGRVVLAAACGEEYGFTDVDGKRPRPLKFEDI
jgi:dehydrogenase/reductase SDR family member 1